MMRITVMPAKDPSAILDYGWNWSEWLAGDTLTNHAISVTTGITVADSSRSSTAVTVRLSGGTAGSDYEVTCHVTTSSGEEDDRTFIVPVRAR